jgi:hypothetical protein
MTTSAYFHNRYMEKRDEILAKGKERQARRSPEERERKLQYNREYYAAHREEQLTKQASQRAAMSQDQKEKRRQQRREYYLRNRQHIIDQTRKYEQDHPEWKFAGRIKRAYGIEVNDRERILKQQGGKCAICGAPEGTGRERLHIDHDHDNGRIRGLLCSRCNTGLGYFADNKDRLAAAIDYLRGDLDAH